jgi:eukaryotic-like serine/threonine-protein kinase
MESSGGHIKGKLSYMAPEHAYGRDIDRRADLFGVGVVLWEALTGERLFLGDNDVETIKRLVSDEPAPLAEIVPELAILDPVLRQALAKTPEERFDNALAMATALETVATDAKLVGTHAEVAAMVKDLAGEKLEERRNVIRDRLAAEPTLASMLEVTPESLRVSKSPGSSPSLAPAVPGAPASSPSLEAPVIVSMPAPAEAPRPEKGASRKASPTRAYLIILAAAVAGLLVAVTVTMVVARPKPGAQGTVAPIAAPIASAPASESAVATASASAPQAPVEPADMAAGSAAPSASVSSSAPRRVPRAGKKPTSNPLNVNLK